MLTLPSIQQSPTAADFVADPYPFYDRARTLGDFVFWEDYDIAVATSHEAVNAVLAHPAMGREPPLVIREKRPAHLATYHAIDDHSLLRLEDPEHTRLRDIAMDAISNEVILTMAPATSQLCDGLISSFPRGTVIDLQSAYADKVPGIVMMRILGFPDEMHFKFQNWARDIDGLFHAKRDRAVENKAEIASSDFFTFMTDHLAQVRNSGSADGFVGRVVAGAKTVADEEIMALVLLMLQASASAASNAIGTALLLLSKSPDQKLALAPDQIHTSVDECLRFEPPFHLIRRHAQADVTLLDYGFSRDAQVGCLLGSACHDDAVWPDGNKFDPFRAVRPHLGFGKGVHACIGKSLTHMIMKIALPALFSRCPTLQIVTEPTFANDYMFRRLERLDVQI